MNDPVPRLPPEHRVLSGEFIPRRRGRRLRLSGRFVKFMLELVVFAALGTGIGTIAVFSIAIVVIIARAFR